MTERGRTRPVVVALIVALLVAGLPANGALARFAGGREMSLSHRLGDRRYVVTGTRGYVVGTQAGRFPAMGFHTRGEMGGIWSPPMKLLDGIWFGIDDQWIRPAERFTSGYGYSRMALPSPRDGLRIKRVDFLPDGERAALFGLRFTAPNERQRFVLSVEAQSELMKAYPWGETNPSQLDYNLPDEGKVLENGRILFHERGTPPVPNAETHDGWRALVGANLNSIGATTGADFRGPQEPPVICPASGPDAPPAPSRCDDTAYGRGTGGRLRYRVTVGAGQTSTVWVGVAGSERGTARGSNHSRSSAGTSRGPARGQSRSSHCSSRADAVVDPLRPQASAAGSTGASRISPTRFRSRGTSRSARRTLEPTIRLPKGR